MLACVLCALLAVSLPGVSRAAPADAAPADAAPADTAGESGAGTADHRHEVVASLEYGSGSGRVGLEEPVEGGDPWGPTSFDLDESGRIHIADGVNSKIVVVSPEGMPEREVSLPTTIACPADVDAVDDGWYVLDLTSDPAKVCAVDAGGSVTSSLALPDELVEQGITGIRAEDRGRGRTDLFVQLQYAWEVPLSVDGRVRAVKPPRLRREGLAAVLPAKERADHALGDRSGGSMVAFKDWDTGLEAGVVRYRAGRRTGRIEMRSEHGFGAIRPLAGTRDGLAYVSVEEFDAAGAVHTFVDVFDRVGERVASSEIPLARYRAFPVRMLRVGPAESVYTLVPSTDRLEVLRLRQEPADAGVRGMDTGADTGADAGADAGADTGADTGAGRPPVGGPARGEGGPGAGLFGSVAGVVSDVFASVGRLAEPEPAHAAWSRFDAYDRAQEYLKNRWWCSKANYYRSCGTGLPTYITGYNRTYASVPYCWGGWDLPGYFNRRMSRGYDAGDVNCWGGKRWCASGVDCSGLVSRLWGLGHKRNTGFDSYYGLASTTVSYYIGRPGSAGERLGDIYIKPHSHVMMVDYVTIGGARVFEATRWLRYDRVVHPIRAWSGLPGYYARRYNNWWM